MDYFVNAFALWKELILSNPCEYPYENTYGFYWWLNGPLQWERAEGPWWDGLF